MLSEGDLVETDGYFGIITSVPKRLVFLSNGCEAVLDPSDWALVKPLPLKIDEPGGAKASFAELLDGRWASNQRYYDQHPETD